MLRLCQPARMTSAMTPMEKLFHTLFQSHPWHGVSPGDPAGVINAFIEIVPTDTVKYELDKTTGHLCIDRPQRYSSQPPTLYGFIPQTYCGKTVGERGAERGGPPGMKGDGDPIDICVLTEKAIAGGNFLLRARPIGGLRMFDGEEADDKIVAVLVDDISYGNLHDIADCPPGIVDRLRHYFLSYKQLPGNAPRAVRIAEVYDRVEAVEMIRRSMTDYRASYGAPEERLRTLQKMLREEG